MQFCIHVIQIGETQRLRLCSCCTQVSNKLLSTGSNKTAISIHGHLEFVEAYDPTKVDSSQETDWVSFNQIGVHVLFKPPPPPPLTFLLLTPVFQPYNTELSNYFYITVIYCRRYPYRVKLLNACNVYSVYDVKLL